LQNLLLILRNFVELIIIKIIFWLSFFALLYTYVVFPLGLKILSYKKNLQLPSFNLKEKDTLPTVYILMAVYNEELVIEQKLQSVFATNYPTEKIKMLIGSDGSTDKTDELIKTFSKQHTIDLYAFGGRSGKPTIINQLYEIYSNQTKNLHRDVLILTDANVIFEPDTIFELVKYFKDNTTGMVGATIKNTKIRKHGIGFLEKKYVGRENKIKHYESILFKKAMGVFGACYALKANLFKPVPANFIVDDFFISLTILQKKQYIIQNLEAVAYEDVPGKIAEEFRRKRRIGAGNMQNLWHFKSMWFPPTNETGLLFLSHKILRWFGPVYIILCWVSALLLSGTSWLLKFIGYFYAMNFALLLGFFDYIKGIQTNVWKPTERSI